MAIKTVALGALMGTISSWLRAFTVLTILCQGVNLSFAQQGTRQVVDSSQVQPTGAGIGQYEALVIGNNDYLRPGVSKLQTAVNDADAVGKILHDRYGFHVTPLHNATRAQIITALVNYRRTLSENSNLLIYYAGHGSLDKDVDEAYWLPVDSERDNNENWISADDITRDIKAIHSFHVLIISDSCYSGTLTRDANVGITLLDKQKVLARMFKSKSRTLLASGGNEPVADSGGGAGHSVFAGALLQVLGSMEDGQFTADALFEALRPRVAGRSSQVPKYDYIRDSGHEDGDFVFSRIGAKPLVAGGVELGDLDDPSRGDALAANAGNVANLPDPTILDPDTEAVAIRRVLKQYQDAYEQTNAELLWKIWPSASAKTRQNVRTSFANALTIKMNLQLADPNIDAQRATAIVKGTVIETFTPRTGSSIDPRRDPIIFSLEKKNGLWTIVDIK